MRRKLLLPFHFLLYLFFPTPAGSKGAGLFK
jgi:hypothetical protein